jgi:hypothetical protein
MAHESSLIWFDIRYITRARLVLASHGVTMDVVDDQQGLIVCTLEAAVEQCKKTQNQWNHMTLSSCT